MMAARDYRAALHAFTKASEVEKGLGVHRYHMALAHIGLGESGPAAQQLTEALRLQPQLADAARQLGALAASRSIPASVQFNRVGLRAALEFDRINRDQIAEVAVYYLSRLEPLRSTLELGRKEGFHNAARRLCLKNTSDLLKDDLLQKALAENIIRMPDLESLLTALRRVILLEMPPERFQDRALIAFIITLMRQCWFNEYVWYVSEEEELALAERPMNIEKLLGGDVDEGIRALVAELYRPLTSVVDPALLVADLRRIRTNAVRDAIVRHHAEHEFEQTQVMNLRLLGPIQDLTSRKVASQYEGSPYPRWSSLGLLTDEAGWRDVMNSYFSQEQLSFMSSPYEVLIAGCGTGLQAIASSFVYGKNARITAMDISASSLGYAKRMAEKFGATNIEFIQADILDLQDHAEFSGRFEIIECVGVLHHMADPFRGWRALKSCLTDSGLMLIALYSEIARQKWTALKHDPAFPGEECSDKELRIFRQSLFERPDAELGAEFKGIRDLYTTSGFRDLILHKSERRFTMPEIEQFLGAEGLTFRGFFRSHAFEKFKQQFPNETWPGSLANWAKFESHNPSEFAGMYYFWCDRA